MVCYNYSNTVPRRTGYTFITNNSAQTVATNQLVNPGSIVHTSCIGNIIPTGNNSLTFRSCGTYQIDVEIIGTPTAVGSETTGTIQPTINVNGMAIASPVINVTTTNYESQYNVRAITPIRAGDKVTISNLGSFTLTMGASNTLGGYNVNIIIKKLN